MSTTESNTIDEKKAEDSDSTTDKADWKGFSKNLSHGLITGIFFGVIVIGSMGLFLAKVANANILPTECDIQPYPVSEPDINKIMPRIVPIDIIYMNPVKILSLFGLKFWETMTKDTYFIQEANFVNGEAELNFMNDFKNTWLCSLRNKAYPPSMEIKKLVDHSSNYDPENDGPMHNLPKNPSDNYEVNMDDIPLNSPFWAYEFETLKKMVCNSFSIINNVFFYMNYLPEWVTMILFALFFSLIITLIFVANMGYGLWTHISNFGDLMNNLFNPYKFNENRKPPLLQKTEYWYSWSNISKPFYVIIYFIGALYSAVLITPCMVTFYSLFKALGANYIIRDKKFKEGDDPKKVQKLNVFSFIKSALYYKKTFIIILVMLNVMGVTNEYLGTSYLPGVIIAILILIFGLNIFKIDPVSISEELYAVVDQNFPSLNQPQLARELMSKANPVDICSDKLSENIDDQIKGNTVTGYSSVDVLNRTPSSIGQTEYRGGGRSLKKPVTNVSKSKTKFYNLKLV